MPLPISDSIGEGPTWPSSSSSITSEGGGAVAFLGCLSVSASSTTIALFPLCDFDETTSSSSPWYERSMACSVWETAS